MRDRDRSALLAFLKAMGGDVTLVAEAAQESLIIAYTKLEQFRFRAWVWARQHGKAFVLLGVAIIALLIGLGVVGMMID